MKVLIVEDSAEKLTRIQAVLARAGVSASSITSAQHLTAYYARVRHAEPYDIIILDMTFEAHSGAYGKEDAAGIEVLQSVVARGLKSRVIVATQHNEFRYKHLVYRSAEELAAALIRLFPHNVVGLVKVNLAQSAWEREMEEMIRVSARHVSKP